ncbi:MAG TPA: cation:proton antiporter [Drouetiella sp.]|jgi:monovalent cation:H+ antiporter-2, CPA2 family
MEHFALIADLAIIWSAALVAGYLCIAAKQPVMAGYMLAGVAIGPHGLGLINQLDQIKVISEFGVAMLLFALGVDLSLRQIVSSAKKILLAGTTQMLLTIAASWWLASTIGLAPNVAAGFLFGCVCAISSSVIISKVLSERGETDSIHGQILIPLALVQDLSLVLIIPFLPVLQETANANLSDFLLSAGKAMAFLFAIIIGATKVVPHVISFSAKSNNRELFLLTLMVLCLSVALFSQNIGLSIALGAFLAGIMISESPYIHQALTDLMPLRDLFATVFFVSIGMLLDPRFIINHLLEVLTFVLLLVIGKILIGTLSSFWATKNLRSAILVGVGLAQIGEFSFVLLSLGYDSKLISAAMYNLFFAGAVVTLIASPALMTLTPKLLRRIAVGSHGRDSRRRREERINGASGVALDASIDGVLHSDDDDDDDDEIDNATDDALNDHVIVCGFGRIGKNVGHVLEAHHIPFIVIELNAGIMDDLAMRAIRHIYGDAVSPLVLDKAKVQKASCLIVTTPDPISALSIIKYARRSNEHIKIVARAHRTEDINAFLEAGASAVVQPEFEASIEVTRLALQSLTRPLPEIQVALDRIKKQRYKLFWPAQDEKLRSVS